jgi:hypothetical protein
MFQAAWARYKQVLQKGSTALGYTGRTSRAANRNVKMSRKIFKQTVYRCGPSAHKDWSLAAHLAPKASIDRDRFDRPAYIQLRADYLQSVLQPQQMYTVITGTEAAEGHIVFEVLHKSRRPGLCRWLCRDVLCSVSHCAHYRHTCHAPGHAFAHSSRSYTSGYACPACPSPCPPSCPHARSHS